MHFLDFLMTQTALSCVCLFRFLIYFIFLSLFQHHISLLKIINFEYFLTHFDVFSMDLSFDVLVADGFLMFIYLDNVCMTQKV